MADTNTEIGGSARPPGSARAPRHLEALPPRGVRIDEDAGVFRVVANNPGPMTYHGTNTWFVETGDAGGGLALIDPGPDDDDHLAAILAAGEGRLRLLLVSHWHSDHLGLARRLSAATGLPVHGFGEHADRAVRDGDVLGPLTALHTPGHAQDHLCFARADGLLFTADHVMGWSTSVVPPPPYGDARDYLASLRRLLARGDRKLMPGHGPCVTRPAALIGGLLSQRQRRENQMLGLLDAEPRDIDGLMAILYPTLKPGLDLAARANVEGHLAKLVADGRAREENRTWRRAELPPEDGSPGTGC